MEKRRELVSLDSSTLPLINKILEKIGHGQAGSQIWEDLMEGGHVALQKDQ